VDPITLSGPVWPAVLWLVLIGVVWRARHADDDPFR